MHGDYYKFENQVVICVIKLGTVLLDIFTFREFFSEVYKQAKIMHERVTIFKI